MPNQHHDIDIKDKGIDTPTSPVVEGDTLRWLNTSNHLVTSMTLPACVGAQLPVTNISKGGQTIKYVVQDGTQGDTFPYSVDLSATPPHHKIMNTHNSTIDVS